MFLFKKLLFLTVNKQLKNDSLCDTVLNVFSNYRFDGNILVLGTPGGLGSSAQKTSWSSNFEFFQLLLVCLGMGNMAMPTTSPLFVDFCASMT